MIKAWTPCLAIIASAAACQPSLPGNADACTVACAAESRPCPGQLVCGADGWCKEPGATACTADSDAGFDAPIDARQCPSTYTASMDASRYRVSVTPAVLKIQSASCNDDAPGFTHLVALDSRLELDFVHALISSAGIPPVTLGFTLAWVGGAQLPNQPNKTAGWLNITGGPMIDTAWAPGEPNDGNSAAEANAENYVVIWKEMPYLSDVPRGMAVSAVCECDGKPSDPIVQAQLE